MAEISNDSFNIMVVAGFNGAKKYTYESGVIGLAHLLQSPEAKKPNVFIINGDLLPDMPLNRGGALNQDKLWVVVDGVKNLEAAAAVVKPSMERLLAALPETQFLYVTGWADLRNVIDIKQKYLRALAGNHPEDAIVNYLEEAHEEYDAKRDAVVMLQHAVSGLKTRMVDEQDLETRMKLGAELSKARVNLRLGMEEKAEVKYRISLFNLLYDCAFSRISKDTITEMLAENKEKIQTANDRLDHAETGSREFAKLSLEVKTLGNTRRKLMRRLKESVDGETAAVSMRKFGSSFRFVGNIPLPKMVNDVVSEIAKAEYMSILKDAFGRKRKVTIQTDKLQVYEKKSGRYEFNLIVTDGLRIGSGSYAASGNTDLVKRAFVVLTNLGGETAAKVDSAPLNVVIGGKKLFTSFALDPWKDQSNTIVATLAKGPFFSTEEATKLYLAGIRTDETRLPERRLLDTSVSVIKVGTDGSVSHETIKPALLEDHRILSDIEEAATAEKLIKKLKPGTAKIDESLDPDLQKAILKVMRPSEIKSDQLPFASAELITSLIPNAGRGVPAGADSLRVVEFSDIHVGNFGDIPLLKAAAADAMSWKPNVLILNGDNIEGNLNRHMDAPRAENDQNITSEYAYWLKNRKGLTESAVDAEMRYTLEKLRKSTIHNTDAQPGVLVAPLEELISDIIKRGGYVVVTSGNHDNKTSKDITRDEATAVAGQITAYLDGARKELGLSEDWKDHKQDYIKMAPGQNIGAETFTLNGMPVEIRHGMSSNETNVVNFLEKARRDAKFVWYGHGHIVREVVTKGMESVQAPTMAETATDEYVKNLASAVAPNNNLTGYHRTEITSRDGEVLSHEFNPRLRSGLGVPNPLWYEFLKERRDMTIHKEPKEKVQAKVRA